uniref:Uncharacterized protein n=1 Tax=Moniliophthora roreri TaxID=221103 RepID=A0A0W0F7V3_MONRR
MLTTVFCNLGLQIRALCEDRKVLIGMIHA